MSFEGVFENWLKTQEKEETKDKTGDAPELQQQTVHPIGETEIDEDEGDSLQDAFDRNASKYMPVSFSSKQAGGKRGASSPHPVPISGAVGDDAVRQNGNIDTVKQPYSKDGIEAGLGETKETLASMVESKHKKQQNMPVEGQDHQQCHSCSPLTDLRDITPTTSPRGVDSSRLGDPILSPDHDMPMEPDSTSECLISNKSSRCRKKCEISMQKVSQGREDSPCSAGCTGESNAGVKTSAVTVHVEESQAECDSTCMFLASPNAISPASQGEIEERVCPFLTDHEDGASPAHCVCQCRSLPPPTNLLSRDHVPTITTATSASPPSLASPHFTVRIISTKSDHSSSEKNLKATLVSSESHYQSKITSDLEHFVTKLELKRKKKDENLENQTMVASLHDKEFGKQYLSECAETESAISAASEVKTDSTTVKTQLDLSEQCADEGRTSRQECTNNSSELGSGGAKSDARQNEVCDFAKHIDWDTAVAETLESSTSVRGYDGESKPGIILKIRAKAVVPCLERNLELKSVKTVSSGKRKGESMGSPEILSRLRKRQKSESSTSQTLPCSPEQGNSEQHAGHCKTKSKQVKSDAGSNCACRSSSTAKRTRRNTVHVDGDLKANTNKHLSPIDRKFVESCTRLSLLQTLTYNLVCSLFPLIQQQLNHVTPESHHFTGVVDDIIGSLECSDSEEVSKDCEHLSKQLENLTVSDVNLVPVYSPQVDLCSDPSHLLEDFQHKVCCLLQLLLPDLTVSLSDTCLQSPGQLEDVLKRVLAANKIKDKSARKWRVVSV